MGLDRRSFIFIRLALFIDENGEKRQICHFCVSVFLGLDWCKIIHVFHCEKYLHSVCQKTSETIILKQCIDIELEWDFELIIQKHCIRMYAITHRIFYSNNRSLFRNKESPSTFLDIFFLEIWNLGLGLLPPPSPHSTVGILLPWSCSRQCLRAHWQPLQWQWTSRVRLRPCLFCACLTFLPWSLLLSLFLYLCLCLHLTASFTTIPRSTEDFQK